MIIDHLSNALKYLHLNKNFSTAFSFLLSKDLSTLPPGKHLIDGERVFAIIIYQQAVGKEKAVFEAHKKYIDIHCTIEGEDVIGWKAVSQCQTTSAYNDKEDYFLFSEKPELYTKIPKKHFALFFPQDAHAALAGENFVKKIVLKVRV